MILKNTFMIRFVPKRTDQHHPTFGLFGKQFWTFWKTLDLKRDDTFASSNSK